MFSIMAPDEKSLKYSTSLSPFWYVTSRKRLSSSVEYMYSTVWSIIATTVSETLSWCFVSSSASGSDDVR